MTIPEDLRPLVPIVAVTIGFALGQWDAWRRSQREGRGARVLVRLEIDDNLAEARRYRAEAADRALEEMLPPAWQKEAWRSQLPRLPGALSVVQLARVRRFYQRLDLLTEHHERARTAGRDPVVLAREVVAAEELVRLLERDGNPLSPRRAGRRGWKTAARFWSSRPGRGLKRWLDGDE
jgi:hypothetical protein